MNLIVVSSHRIFTTKGPQLYDIPHAAVASDIGAEMVVRLHSRVRIFLSPSFG